MVENWGLRPFLGRGDWVPIYHKVARAQACLHTKWQLDATSRLATMDMGRKLGRGPPPPFWEGKLGPHLTHRRIVTVAFFAPCTNILTYLLTYLLTYKVAWPEAYLHTKWHLDASRRLATIEIGRKLGRGLRPLFGEGSWVPI